MINETNVVDLTGKPIEVPEKEAKEVDQVTVEMLEGLLEQAKKGDFLEFCYLAKLDTLTYQKSCTGLPSLATFGMFSDMVLDYREDVKYYMMVESGDIELD